MIAYIVRQSIKYAGVVVALASAIVLYGTYFFLAQASLDVFPEFSPSQVVIQTEAPDLSAELVERLVTQPIENALAGVAGLAALRSQSIGGLSVVTATFDEASSVYRNRQAVSERLAAAAGQLPQGAGPARITPLTSSASTLLGIGLTSERRSLMELRTFVDWTLRPYLLAVPGVAEVNVFGGEVRQWQVQVAPEKLMRYALTIEDVIQATRAATGRASAGVVQGPNQQIAINVAGQPASVAELARAMLSYQDGRLLRLQDVANIVEGPGPSISAAAIDGTPGVFLMVQGQLGVKTHTATRALEYALGALAPVFADEGIALQPRLFRPANFIETAVRNVQRDIVLGAALVIVVLFLFLFDARIAFICATAIPVSLVAAVLVLEYFGIGLNILILGGLAIALGEVVDDAIIDAENVFRRLRERRFAAAPRPAHEIVLGASVEVRSAVVYATFIVALVFVPLVTLPGVAGKLFAPLGLAYILAIMASLVVALTLTPALCALLLTRGDLRSDDPPALAWLKPRYIALLARVESRPGRVVTGAFALVTLGIAAAAFLAGEFIPPLREGHYIIHMTAVPGTAEAESLRIGRMVSAALRSIDGVQSVAQWVGRAPNGADTFGTHYSEFEVEIGAVKADEQTRILSEIRATLAGRHGAFPGVTFAVNTFLTERIEETVTGYAGSFIATIFGADLDALDRDAQAVATAIAGVRGARDVALQAPPGTPEISIRLRLEQLAALGLQPAPTLQTIRAAYGGTVTGQIYEGNRVVDLVVALDPRARNNIPQLGALPLRAADGSLVRLADVADVRLSAGRYKILHTGGRRSQIVTASVAGRDIEAFEAEARQRIAQQITLAPGNYVELGGAAQARGEARRSLLLHAVIAGIGVLLLLFLAFGNVRNMAVTTLNLPFALIGGVGAVLSTGGWLSLGSLVGFVTLFGITLRNSIMLVSHYQRLVAMEGMPWNRETALRGAAERLPSILITALVTALALLPIAVGTGEAGREIEGPMATVIVGGLITSTALNLLVLPTILLRFGRFER